MLNFFRLITVSKKVLQLPSYENHSMSKLKEMLKIISGAVSSLCRKWNKTRGGKGVYQGHKDRCREGQELQLSSLSCTTNAQKETTTTTTKSLLAQNNTRSCPRNGEHSGPSPADFHNKAVMNPWDVPVAVTHVSINCVEKALLLNKWIKMWMLIED